MKLNVLLAVAIALGTFGCESNASDTTPPNVQPQHAGAAQAADENSEPRTPAPAANPENNNGNDLKPPRLKALPQLSSRGATRVEMRNVDFHNEDRIVLRIRSLQGALLRRNNASAPVFDDKRSFVLRIDSGTVGIRPDSLTELMNDYIFAYPHAPLKKINISTKGSQIKMAATLNKAIDVPIRIVGDLTPTPEGKIRLHPTSIKAAGIPVKGFMHLFGLDLSELMETNEERGVTIDDDDIIMDPERMIPPPAIRGRVTAVRVEGDEVIQVFGKDGGSAGAHPDRRGSNYMHYRGGTLRFGKLTMSNADLRIVDADPKDAFDFSIDHYNSQLVAGHSKNTPGYGLVVVMPDYYRVRGVSRIMKEQQPTAGFGLSQRIRF